MLVCGAMMIDDDGGGDWMVDQGFPMCFAIVCLFKY